MSDINIPRPEEIQSFFNAEQNTLINDVTNIIINDLKKNFTGGVLTITYGKSLNDKVKNKIISNFAAKGWNVAFRSRSDQFDSFTEITIKEYVGQSMEK